MNIIVNGKPQSVVAGMTIQMLLEQLQVTQNYLAVARNCECVTRQQYGNTFLQENDAIEILSPMAGG